MPAKRTYNVRVAKDFIVLAGIFFFLCLWAVKDAWYPSDKVLTKHPRMVEASFETAGTVGSVRVSVGDSVGEDQILAVLLNTKKEVEFNAAKKEYTAAKKQYTLLQESVHNAENSADLAELQRSVAEAKIVKDSALKKVGKIRAAIDSSELLSPAKGVITEARMAPHSQAKAGQAAFVIDPQDHFYLFNKSLAIFSFLAFWVFLGLHFFTQ